MRKILLVVFSVVCAFVCFKFFPQFFGQPSGPAKNSIQFVPELPPEGSIQTLTIPENGNADEILKTHPVKERMNILKMDKTKFTDKGAETLKSYPDLTQILISETQTGDGCANCISQCKRFSAFVWRQPL